MSEAVPAEILENSLVVLQKYYRPLGKHTPVAADLYRRIICFPCHPEIETIRDHEIADLLTSIKKRVERRRTRRAPDYPSRFASPL